MKTKMKNSVAKNNLELKDFVKIIKNINKTMEKNVKTLTKIDSNIGDGDHGTTIARGFKSASLALEEEKLKDISSALVLTGETLVASMGGASGPLFGTFFRAMGQKVPNKNHVNLEDLCLIFSFAYENLLKISGAKPGEKTMIDSLDPAVESLKTSVAKKDTLEDALNKMVIASKKGMLATKNYVAKKGRAKYLKERSLGLQDAGATSMYLIIKTFYESIFCGKKITK